MSSNTVFQILFLYALATALTFRLRLGPLIRLVQLTAIVAMCGYAERVPFYVKQHDVVEHLEHVDAVLRGTLVPDARACWECFQPPIYYWVAAIVTQAADALAMDRNWLLQFLNLGCVVAFQSFGLHLVTMYFPRIASRPVCAVTFLLWPSLTLHARRVSNDHLMWMLATLALVLFVRWRRDSNLRQLYAAVACAALTTFVKSTGAVTLLAFAAFSVIDHWRGRPHARSGRRAALVTCISFCAVVALSHALAIYKGGNVGTTQFTHATSLAVENRLEKYVWLDLESYLTHPDTSVTSDTHGRQYLWNYLLKTLLWGEWPIQENLRALARVANFALLALLASLLASLATLPRPVLRGLQFPGAVVFLHVASITAYRFIHPFSVDQDFRLIFNILPVTIILLCMPLEFRVTHGPLERARRYAVTILCLTIAVTGQTVVALTY